MSETKETIHFDLYGWSVSLEMLKRDYSLVSFRRASIPTEGSPCRRIETLNEDAEVVITRTVRHRDETITLITNKGFFRFWK